MRLVFDNFFLGLEIPKENQKKINAKELSNENITVNIVNSANHQQNTIAQPQFNNPNGAYDKYNGLNEAHIPANGNIQQVVIHDSKANPTDNNQLNQVNGQRSENNNSGRNSNHDCQSPNNQNQSFLKRKWQECRVRCGNLKQFLFFIILTFMKIYKINV